MASPNQQPAIPAYGCGPPTGFESESESESNLKSSDPILASGLETTSISDDAKEEPVFNVQLSDALAGTVTI